jgi:hypothetical protein
MTYGEPNIGARQSAAIAFGFVLLFGFCARAATYKSPLLDHHAWRQADTASIARNFDRERLNVFYPQIDQRGGQQFGYVETGLELFAFIVALLARLVGFAPQVGRLLSALLFVCSCVMVRSFVRRRYGEECGLVAAFLYAFGFPLLVWAERAFMNESLLICLSIGALLLAQRYLEQRGGRNLTVLILVTALIGAIKLPYLIVWAPIAGLFLEADGSRAWRWPLGLMMLVNLIVAAAWYRHAHQLAAVTGLSFGMTDKLFDADVVFSLSFARVIASRIFQDILGPVGVVGALAGLWCGMRERRWCEAFGAAGFAAYLVLVAGGNYVHDYYQLALIPIAPPLVSLGLIRLAAALTDKPDRRTSLVAVALGAAAIATFARSASAHSWYEYAASDVELCRFVAALSLPTERVVVLGTSDPKLLFCMDRKGWLIPSVEDDSAIRRAWETGAKLVVAPKASLGDNVRHFLTENGDVIDSTMETDLVRLH